MATTSKAPASVQELAERYDAAWNDHDLETILALQTPDSKFVLHGFGGPQTWDGLDECRECYEFLLRAVPDQHFASIGLVVKGDTFIGSHELSGTFAEPWKMGDKVYQPTGKKVSFDQVDIITCKDNRVHIKNAWMDGFSLAQQLEQGA